MQIKKRNGSIQELDLNKIVERVRKQSVGLNVDADMIATKTIPMLVDGISSKEIDKQLASLAESYSILHPDYNYLAGRIANTALHKDVPYPNSPYQTWQLLSQHYELEKDMLDNTFVDYIFNKVISESTEHEFDYQGVRVIANQYSFKVNGEPVETPDLVRFRVAYYLGRSYGADFVGKVFKYLRGGLFTFATPINLNSGLEKAQLASCFLIGLEGDSYEGIMNTQKEAGNISRHAGGIGMHISNLRAKGSMIKSSGAKSAGIAPFMKLTEANANYWNQGGKRKGSYAIYLEPWHADVFDFLEMRSNQGLEANRARDLFYALWIPDLFMEAVEQDKDWYLFCPSEAPNLSDVHGKEFENLYNKYVSEGKYRKKVKARELWDVIVSLQIETGLPFLLYKDTVNRYSMQKNLGTIKSSNLCCVHGDTQLLTNKGYTSIGSLQDKEVTIWNGEEWSDVTVRKTGESQSLMKIGMKGYKDILCTDYHKFPVIKKYSKKYKMVEAKDLKVGDRLLKWDKPLIEGTTPLPLAYLNGFYTADGTYDKASGKQVVYLCGDKQKLKPYISLELAVYENYNKKLNRYYAQYPSNTLYHKYFVPSIQYTVESRLQWLAGVLDGDGCVDKVSGRLLLASSRLEFLREVQMMVETLGCSATIKKVSDLKVRLFPDVAGKSTRPCICKESYALTIGSSSTKKLWHLGLRCNRVKLIEPKFNKTDASQYMKVDNLAFDYTIADTYCLTEPKRNMMVVNGILTGQSEIVEYSSPEETAVCNLANINLPLWYKADDGTQEEVVEIIVRLLNKAIDYSYYPDSKTRKSNLSRRPLGIGVQGLAEVFVNEGVPFDSKEAQYINTDIFLLLYQMALNVSTKLVEEGRYHTYEGWETSPYAKGFDHVSMYDLNANTEDEGLNLLPIHNLPPIHVTNSLLIALMPTVTTSQLLGNTESFEPFTSLLYRRRGMVGDYTVINRQLVKKLEELGLWTDTVRDQIIDSMGSIQHIDCIPDDVKKLYKTVWELDPQALLDLCIGRQPYVDQAMSMNLFMENPNKARLTQMLFHGWKNGLKTGVYYTRSRSALKSKKV
jgi:ribonucleoside-diphosphate reductase alpha chain